jgi:hypothetical protein
MKLPSLPFTKLELITWLFMLLRAFLYSLIVTGTSAKEVLASNPLSAMDLTHRWMFAIGLFIVQAGLMLAFLDSTISKLMQLASANPQPSVPTSTNQTKAT